MQKMNLQLTKNPLKIGNSFFHSISDVRLNVCILKINFFDFSQNVRKIYRGNT